MLFRQRREHEAGGERTAPISANCRKNAGNTSHKTWTRQIRGLPRSPAEFIK
jgi:hypothetical protein